jgi:hypothetical protein
VERGVLISPQLIKRALEDNDPDLADQLAVFQWLLRERSARPGEITLLWNRLH